MDVSCLNLREQNRHGPYKVCILHKPNEKPQSGSKITLFELSKDMVPGMLSTSFSTRGGDKIFCESSDEVHNCVVTQSCCTSV